MTPAQRRAVLEDWIERTGWICPGHGVRHHPADRLVVVSLVPPWVLCRSCFARRAKEMKS